MLQSGTVKRAICAAKLGLRVCHCRWILHLMCVCLCARIFLWQFRSSKQWLLSIIYPQFASKCIYTIAATHARQHTSVYVLFAYIWRASCATTLVMTCNYVVYTRKPLVIFGQATCTNSHRINGSEASEAPTWSATSRLQRLALWLQFALNAIEEKNGRIKIVHLFWWRRTQCAEEVRQWRKQYFCAQ